MTTDRGGAPSRAPAAIDRRQFFRVCALHNGKGGVFKSSLATNLAAIFADSEMEVLLVDTDQQGTCDLDLGYTDRTDEGAGLLRAMVDHTAAPTPLTVRPHLDVIPGGHELRHLDDLVHDRNQFDLLVPVLAPWVDRYDVILIDTPPADRASTKAALGVAHHLLIPSRPDMGSLRGLQQVANTVGEANEINPWLAVLAIILIGIPTNAVRIRRQAAQDITEMLGNADLLLNATIRTSDASAALQRSQGRHILELATAATGLNIPHLLRHGQAIPDHAASAPNLLLDYLQVANEIKDRINAHEQADEEDPS